MTPRYTTWGPVRSGCGHAHKSIAAAVACMLLDRRRVARIPGGHSSDRVVVASNEQGQRVDVRLAPSDRREVEAETARQLAARGTQ